MTLGVVIAAERSLARAGMAALLAQHDELAVLGEAATVEELVALIRATRPDVALVDRTIAKKARACTPHGGMGAPLVVLVSPESSGEAIASLRSGAQGCLAEDSEPHELVDALRTVAKGQVALCSAVAEVLVEELLARPSSEAEPLRDLASLTTRERDVLLALANGLTNDEISERLYISPATAKTHVSRIMGKLAARHRSELVVAAYEAGLVKARGVPPEASARRRTAGGENTAEV